MIGLVNHTHQYRQERRENNQVTRRLGMQRTHACIFARFTRKMHGNDSILESGCLTLRSNDNLVYGV